jgi:bifunctional DNA-binding transcriptional regulator/antitoxin component of YhaV-PrlF toxin-antitoxin module
MTKVIKINGRRTLTLPKELRPQFGMEGGGQVVAEETDDGILLRSGVTFPLEIHNAKRRAEFTRNNDQAPAGQRFKK